MNIVYLSLGTNLGDKEHNLLQAIEEIEKRIGSIQGQSAFLETEPWGFDSDNTFLNAAVRVATPLSPSALLRVTQAIERKLGRTHKSVGGVYHDRLIDIDILYFIPSRKAVSLSSSPAIEDLDSLSVHIARPSLTIPHPHIHERDFVLTPLSQIR
ncbi:MAG: 2-amino-4-hydroxy-6-hydroxymethyldihydropteridine diphosphokinase [Bacteroidaceae bacterium]|nr:2-amino-4-hydroxy-6-hydroxymethyldihydropteridine diphosphokinase [Bacteroidaceae bacterium]